MVDDEHLDSRSRISNPDNVIGRLMSIENSIAKLNYQQDQYRQLLEMRNELDRVKRVDQAAKKTSARVDKHESDLSNIQENLEAFEDQTEQNLRKVGQSIRDEASTRILENKKIKSVAKQLEQRQKQAELDFKIAATQVEKSCRSEILEVARENDKKVSNIRDYFQTEVSSIQENVTHTFKDDQGKFKDLFNRFERFEQATNARLNKLDGIVFPQIDSSNKRRKVDYEDLKSWLAETVDKHVQDKTVELEAKYENKYKSIINKQKQDINDLQGTIKKINERNTQAAVVTRPERASQRVTSSKKQLQTKSSKPVLSGKDGEFSQGVQDTRAHLNEAEELINETNSKIKTSLEDMKVQIEDQTRFIKAKISEFGAMKSSRKDPS